MLSHCCFPPSIAIEYRESSATFAVIVITFIFLLKRLIHGTYRFPLVNGQNDELNSSHFREKGGIDSSVLDH